MFFNDPESDDSSNIFRYSSAFGTCRCLVCFVSNVVGMHGPRTKHTKHLPQVDDKRCTCHIHRLAVGVQNAEILSSRIVPSKSSTEHLPANFPATCSLSSNLGVAAAAVGGTGAA